MLNLKFIKYLFPHIILLAIAVFPYCSNAQTQAAKPDTSFIDKNSFVPLYKYMASTVKYPRWAKESGTQGTIVLSFNLTEKGIIENAAVENATEVKKAAHGIDDEALLAIKRFKDKKLTLKPGLYYLPVTFIIQNLTAPSPLDPEFKKLPNCLAEIMITVVTSYSFN